MTTKRGKESSPYHIMDLISPICWKVLVSCINVVIVVVVSVDVDDDDDDDRLRWVCHKQ